MRTLRTGVCLAVVASLVLTACPAPAPQTPPQETAEAVAAIEEVTQESAAAAIPEEEPTGVITGCAQLPDGLILSTEDKPPLALDVEPSTTVDQIIGFVFPDGLAALKAAALSEIAEQEGTGPAKGLTKVGLVEAGDPSTPYEVAIRLGTDKEAERVSGMLIPIDQSKERVVLEFTQVPVALNQAREGDPPPTVSVSITSWGVCYVVKSTDGAGFWQYCSIPDTEGGNLLSVSNTFEEEYKALMDDIISTAAVLDLTIIPGLTISEMEDPVNISNCINDGDCRADIVGAPVASFDDVFDQRSSQSTIDGCSHFSVDAGVVNVLRPIQSGSVEPGQYKVTFWFETESGAFAGATISGETEDGETEDGETVENQPIPATPATFLGGDSVSQISAWRLRKWCWWWQKKCP